LNVEKRTTRGETPRDPDPTDALPPLVPLEGAAAFFHVTTRTFRRWCRSGRVRTLRTNPDGSGRVLIERTEMRRLIESMRQLPPGGGAP
jgi:hypothetical protein